MGETVRDVSYRVRLASELRKSIRPVMKAWGFDNPPKGSPDWFHSTRLHTWVRQREGFTDEIYIEWGRYGDSRYAISLRTDQVERMLAPDQPAAFGTLHDVEVLNWRLYAFGGRVDIRWVWTMGRRSLRDEIAHALKRLAEANHYLLTGEASRNIFRRGCCGSQDDPPEPVFWWREGATGARNREIAAQRAAKLAKRS